MDCVETMRRAKIVLPNSTCSQHFQILRDGGLIHRRRERVELTSRLRIRELEHRFVGLPNSILKAYKKEKSGATN
jgi:hypothetical protein